MNLSRNVGFCSFEKEELRMKSWTWLKQKKSFWGFCTHQMKANSSAAVSVANTTSFLGTSACRAPASGQYKSFHSLGKEHIFSFPQLSVKLLCSASFSDNWNYVVDPQIRGMDFQNIHGREASCCLPCLWKCPCRCKKYFFYCPAPAIQLHSAVLPDPAGRIKKYKRNQKHKIL